MREINMAGIKWIASFPDNIQKGIPRAHSVVILNNADTGEPVGIINTALLSIIRTASVSGLMIRYFEKVRELKKIKLGIVGFGPIGQYHLKMCTNLLNDNIDQIFLYDINDIDRKLIDENVRDKVSIVNSWEEAYQDADIFITCTVSKASYIDKKPKAGSLHLNVSLRDYKTDVFDWFKDSIIVDDWEEVCREKTDIEMLHLEKGLMEKDTISIKDIVMHNIIDSVIVAKPLMFNPMGMAIFDLGIGKYYFEDAISKDIGISLI